MLTSFLVRVRFARRQFSPSLAFAFFANAVRADNSKFLFEVLHANKSTYRVAWNKLMKLVQPTPDWLVQFNKDFDGVAGQVNNVTIDGKPYSVSFVCKPTDCAAHQFVVLFDEKGTRAYGALGGKDNAPFFYGSPSQAEQDEMAKAVGG